MKLVRVLNDVGVQKFREYLGNLKADGTVAPPTELLDDPATSGAFDSAAKIESRDFGSRLEAAQYFQGKFSGMGSVDYNSGLSWLALFYFDQVCPPATDSGRLVGDGARYIPAHSGR